MFWSKKRIDDDKEKQIKDLKVVFPSIRRPNNDDTLFEIKFVVDNQYSSLRIFIPADFPVTRPVLQVSGPVTHPWLDQFKQVNGCAKLMNWSKSSVLVEVVEECMSALLSGVNAPPPNVNISGNGAVNVSNQSGAAYYNPTGGVSALGASQYSAVQSPFSNAQGPPSAAAAWGQMQQMQQQNSVIQHMQQQVQHGQYQAPPTLYTPNNSAQPHQPHQLPAAISTTTTTTKPTNKSVNSPNITMPDIPQSFPELENLTDLQLERILNDEMAFQANLQAMASVDSIRSLRDQMRKSNAEAASKNLIMGEEINFLQEQATALQKQFIEKSNAYSDKLSQVTKQFEVNQQDVLRELNAKCAQLDDRSEDMGRAFVDGKMELSAFTQEYVEVRASYHGLSSKLATTTTTAATTVA